MDLAGGLLGTLILFLLMPIIAFFIKLESKGPIFFFQTRVGQYGRTFKFIKFRTMIVDAHVKQGELDQFNETGGVTFKMSKDPRITKVGKWLRRTSLDEIPQFWLVLLGKMSLVGPRPPLIGEVERYDDYQKIRMTVPQGMSGLWQVKGRSNTKFSQMANLDVYYAQNCSFLMDISIILKTFPVIFFGRGAK